mmetsp:Transcript_53022/g.87899  ORF Transcript_53022/g.87899 Transcript_53022/m.87899 type:complete len:153 (+) Transcript_53022:66-524(+)
MTKKKQDTAHNRVSWLTRQKTMEDILVDEDLPREVVDDVCKHDEETKEALNKLYIDPGDREKLADILDPDHSGSIGFLELVNGLQRLRGLPRRSDIVTIDLMLRSVQEKMDEIETAIMKNSEVCFEMHNALSNFRVERTNSRTSSLPASFSM